LRLILARQQLRIRLAISGTGVETFRQFRGHCYVVDGDVVLAAFHAGQQISLIGHDKIRADIELTREHLAQFHFETGELAVLLEIERRGIGLNGDSQLATVVDVIDQFRMGHRAQQG
jgi:hypothetical protein